ncbi:MAG: amidohydrolase, partial [Chloroflexi bacterium]|nr:amidohydrolase [Chloroflexota bacterium]
MASTDELKDRLCRTIDSHRGDTVAIANTILRHPETGFKEFQTAKLVAGELAKMGLPYREGLAMTGVKAKLEGASPGPTVAVMGELDA